MIKKTRAGDSSEQRKAEEYLINRMSKKMGKKLIKKRINLGNNIWTEVDGYNESPLILCEIWAHIGKAKSAQKNKIMTDALKLKYIESLMKKKAKCYLIFADKDAASCFMCIPAKSATYSC